MAHGVNSQGLLYQKIEELPGASVRYHLRHKLTVGIESLPTQRGWLTVAKFLERSKEVILNTSGGPILISPLPFVIESYKNSGT